MNRKKKRNRSRSLTSKAVAALRPGQTLTETWGYGEGALQVRAGKKGARYFFRYGPEQTRIALPSFNEAGEPISLAEARQAGRALSARYQAGERELKAALEAEQRARARELAALRQAEQAAHSRQRYTFGALMTAYVRSLEQRGRISAHDTGHAIGRYIEQPHPDTWEKPAADITLDDVLAVLEPLTSAGKLRTAGKVRSFIRAAYAAAIRSRTSAQASELRLFNIEANPAADVQTIEGSNKARDRALSVIELRALWKRISKPDERAGPLLRFYLLTGGQRFAQLRRARVSDITDEGLVLWDSKGRRAKPRRHVVPLLPEALQAIEDMAPARIGEHVATLTGGTSPADSSAFSKLVGSISRAMVKAGEAVEGFTVGDLRRTVETRLAALGVSMEIRAQLQSHGLSGVQARHYDRHDYWQEKREALERLRDLMTKPAADVAAITAFRQPKRAASAGGE